mmetsp:Transcript_93206/g.268327  ORF Transcript_93206/g.268327 Transcript_93206/m.268327 type:complete len:497 (-) Transcript_93206:280-1770(-)
MEAALCRPGASSREIETLATAGTSSELDDDPLETELCSSGSTPDQRSLGMWAIVFIVFFNVSGGPFGSEEIVSTCGPLPGFIGIFVFMLLWGMPVALVTAELSTALPDNGGYSIWVSEAFGEFWGFQESYWSWTSGVVDNAVYPVLAYETAVRIFGGRGGEPLDEDESADGGWTAFMCKLVLVILFTLPNLLSPRSFGLGLGFAFAMVAVPFLVFSVLSIYNAGGGTWSIMAASRHDASWHDYAVLGEALYWNWNGFDCVSTCAGEVRDPARSFPRGLMTVMGIILLAYLIPLSAAVVCRDPNWELWQAGWMSTIALEQVGHWMARWIVVAAFVSNFGQYSAELFEDSWQLAGMADVGMLPKIFARRHNLFGTPWFAICFQVAIIVFLVSFDFMSIVIVDNCFSVIGTLLELAAFIKLRLAKPDMPRPFAVPIRSKLGLAVFMCFPLVLGMTVFVSTFTGGGWRIPAINFVGLACGPLLHWAIKRFSGARYVHGHT